MMKRIIALLSAVICLFLFAACGGDPAKGGTEQTGTQSGSETENGRADPASSVTDPDPSVTSPETAGPDRGSGIARISGGADEVGIYSVVVRLTDQAADKGTVEMVYYGPKGTPQENSVVSTFRIEYDKGADGTYEITTFFDGELYQNQHHKDEVKVVNTFGAALRAGNVIISYTPDGGETQEIFRADADYFYAGD